MQNKPDVCLLCGREFPSKAHEHCGHCNLTRAEIRAEAKEIDARRERAINQMGAEPERKPVKVNAF